MKRIDKPLFKISAIISDSLNNMQDQNLKTLILNNLHVFEDFENDFDTKKNVNNLYLIGRNITIAGQLDANTLKKLYTGRMLKKSNDARIYYDKLLNSAPKGKCVNCNVRNANTLDHYLPKSEYPILAVSPLNLVPSCSNCNTGKLIDYPTCDVEEVIHPYYDDVDAENWLDCQLISVKPMIFDFFVKDSVFTNLPLLRQRLIKHFESFELNDLYITHSSEEFESIKFQVTKLYNNGGYTTMKEYLYDCYESRLKVDINSWRTVFYKCLFESDDFCNGQFM
ncbi:HNH endonuclease [Chryseobacterium vrystaatense]|uniref:HNH endonuclease n=1 Tax=Chryseobacterium vrystaatense TaxID=307480 RepID=A0A1M4YWB5_9FLAO|nr:hypothetical protein [Chryseobacterium vrystaatense]SHF10114.1 hypothetical protein SAMN02787073_1402 [Chryseobacterium vrystaatense]